MSQATAVPWKEQFGLDVRVAPEFFAKEDELIANAPQAHLLQRGFDYLELDGVLCSGNSPLVYFRYFDELDPQSTDELYRSFWHHGGAPVLVLVSNSSVNIYSGLTRPSVDDTSAGLVETLDRVKDDLAAFLLSVESGDFFHSNRQYFNPEHRVDRALLSNLRDTRKQLNDLSQRRIPDEVLDGLLCRLVFTAYLFDRGVVGEEYLRSLNITDCDHLRDVLRIQPTGQAKSALYRLFDRLAQDFNGDLFADNLKAESKWIVNRHIEVLSAFFHGTSVKTGQQSFWPYDFGTIPIETISAIYEHFLKDIDKNEGAFYTPRFLAEIVLDIALEKEDALLGSTFLDPACGSGIFLVGLFNRLAQEWQRVNPRARNDTIARELMTLIRDSLFGVDVNPTACRIAAFSLYLAYLDQLSPRDIQQLQEKGRALPNLISDATTPRNITCADFFGNSDNVPNTVSLVIGNPPWGSTAGPQTPAGRWSHENEVELPDKQIASAFIRKAAVHVDDDGRVCFVLPAGVLFNHGDKAVEFQKEWVTRHTLECVLNLADYQRFLFEVAGYPALVARYRRQKPSKRQPHRIDYWSPKSDWSVTKAEVIRIAAEDRVRFSLGDLLASLDSSDAPQIWKRHFWATPRDRRLLERLSDLPRLHAQIRGTREKSDKPWVIGHGFEPLGLRDDNDRAKHVELEVVAYVEATAAFDLILSPQDCIALDNRVVDTRRSMQPTALTVFRPPHVLITQGFANVAFADFYVSFRHSIRGIHGPDDDAEILAFLAAYLRSDIARFFLFHTSSNWGVLRDRVLNDELLQLPFVLPPVDARDTTREEIVSDVAAIVRAATKQSNKDSIDRSKIVADADAEICPLIEAYFGVTDSERELINDTINIIIPSTRPTRSRLNVPTVKRSSTAQRDAYARRVCDTLNGWSKRSGHAVRGQVTSSAESGIGLAIFEKVDRSLVAEPMPPETTGVIETLKRLREIASRKHVAFELMRGIKVFDRDRLYVVKTLDQRNWTLTAAMNDADEIAGSLLMKMAGQPA